MSAGLGGWGISRMADKGRVAWREGMFLRPQHFQQQDRFLVAEIHARVSASQPYAWGLSELVIDEDLAAIGKFSVVRCSGVMPDGTAFSISKSMPSGTAYSVAEEMPPPADLDVPADTRDGIIYLTLPVMQPGAVAFQETKLAAPDIRFLVDEEQTANSFSEDRTREAIDVARPNLRFGITRDQTHRRVCLGLVRVRELQNKRLMFDVGYIPPAQDIRACERLKGWLTDIFRKSDLRVEELALRSVEAVSAGTDSVTGFLLLQALNRWCPMLKHLDSLPVVHPERLYESFVGMAGELATLVTPERRPPSFPEYDHENLQATFEPVVKLLREMLGTIIAPSVVQLPLKLEVPGSYVSVITDHSLYQHGYFYLAVHAAMPLEDIRSLFPSHAKIGAVQKMLQIVGDATGGIPLRHATQLPPQLRPLPGYVYFELDRSCPDWRDFASAAALGLHLGGIWPSLKLELWCLKRPGA